MKLWTNFIEVNMSALQILTVGHFCVDFQQFLIKHNIKWEKTKLEFTMMMNATNIKMMVRESNACEVSRPVLCEVTYESDKFYSKYSSKKNGSKWKKDRAQRNNVTMSYNMEDECKNFFRLYFISLFIVLFSGKILHY